MLLLSPTMVAMRPRASRRAGTARVADLRGHAVLSVVAHVVQCCGDGGCDSNEDEPNTMYS